jgi:hypothetical protein
MVSTFFNLSGSLTFQLTTLAMYGMGGKLHRADLLLLLHLFSCWQLWFGSVKMEI